MACFQLTAHQRSLLASCIEIGAEGLVDSDEANEDIAAIEAFLAELQGESVGFLRDIEITIAPMGVELYNEDEADAAAVELCTLDEALGLDEPHASEAKSLIASAGCSG